MQSFITRSISSSSLTLCLSSKPHFSSRVLTFGQMNPSRRGGWASIRNSPHHQGNSLLDTDGSVNSYHIGASQLDRNSSSNSAIFDSSDAQNFPALGATQNEPKRPSALGRPSLSPSTNRPGQPCDHLSRPDHPKNVATTPQITSPKTEHAYSCNTQADSKAGSSKVEHGVKKLSEDVKVWQKKAMPTTKCARAFDSNPIQSSANIGNVGDLRHHSPEHVNTRTPQPRKSSPKRDCRRSSLDDADCKSSNAPFDICKKKSQVVGLKPSLLDTNRAKRKDTENSLTDDRPSILRPGMVLLKNYLSHSDQINIIKKCRELGVGEGGFYQPGYKDGAKLHLHMMCLGKDWDPQIKTYGDVRFIDGAKPPNIPAEFKKLVSEAIQESHAIMQEQRIRNPDMAIPLMEPDVCIVNFYSESGKLGLHQDRDESSESLRNRLPVVSFSIGDSADFLYGDERDPEKAEKVTLKSGDVLIFGGKSRHIFHGVPSIISHSAPNFLLEEGELRPGRLNLTFRKY